MTVVFLVESRIKVTGLYGNHEVQNNERTKDHTGHEEEVKHVRSLGITDNVHHVGPAFKGNDLENVHDRQQNVIKAIGTRNRISVHFTGQLYLLVIAHSRNISLKAIYI